MKAIAIPRYFLWMRRKEGYRYKFDSVNEFLTSEYNSLNHRSTDCELDNLQIIWGGVVSHSPRFDVPTMEFMLEDKNKDRIEIVHLAGDSLGRGADTEIEIIFWNKLLEYKKRDRVDVRFKIKGIINLYYRLEDMALSV